MGWGAVALLLLGCAAFGALLGAAPARIRGRWLVAAAVLAGFLVFLPGTCATAIAAAPLGDPELMQGRTSCWFLSGPAVPELGPLDGGWTARLLQLAAVFLAVTALLLVRRARRRPVMPPAVDRRW